MQTVCPYHKIELTTASVFEPNLYAVCLLLKVGNFIVENDFVLPCSLSNSTRERSLRPTVT